MTTLYHPRPERWPQVSLRTFFVLLTLLCVFLGWAGVQLKWIRDRRIARGNENVALYFGPEMTNVYGKRIGRAPWSLRLFGESGVVSIELRATEPPSDAGPTIEETVLARQLKDLFPEAEIVLRHSIATYTVLIKSPDSISD